MTQLAPARGALELVRRMRHEAFSRNRHFDAFATAEARSARKLWRYLRSLEEELLGKGVELRVERRSEGGRRLVILVPQVRMQRIAVLSEEEYQLLRERTEVRAVLDRLA